MNASGEWRVASGERLETSPHSPLVPRHSIARASALIAVSACCFGSVLVLAEVAKRAGAPLLSILAWRYLAGAVLLAAASGGFAALRRPRRSALALLVGGGGGQSTLAYLSLAALDYVPAATAAFLFYTYPAWVAIFAVVRRTERVDATRITALALSLGGILLMVGSPWSGPLDPRGVVLALAAAVVYALFMPFINHLQRGIASEVAAAYVAGGAGVVFATAGLATGTLRVELAPAAWLAIAALAVLSTALAFITLLRGLAVLGPVRTAIVSTIEPFWTLLLAVPALGQPLRPATAAGGVLIAAAVLLLQVRGRAGQPHA